jgi:hypothetical protein
MFISKNGPNYHEMFIVEFFNGLGPWKRYVGTNGIRVWIPIRFVNLHIY